MKTEVKLEKTEAGVLTILEGKVLDQKYPEKIKISGNIDSVRQFLNLRSVNGQGDGLQAVNKKTAVITVDEEKMFIHLTLNPNDPFGTEVTGSLEFTKELNQFSINEPRTFTREELIKLLRFSKILFDDPSKHESLLTAYQKFDMSAAIKLSQESDTRGNKAMNFDKKLLTNLPTEFTLRLPIFKGQKPERFRVEICMDSTDASVRFWFESVELHDLIETRKIEIFVEQLAKFQDFVIINK